jgi:phosphorylcholine metabolism protein LicD
MEEKNIIFGAGYHGRNALRALIRKKNNNVIFLDNNYSLTKKKILGKKVYLPKNIKKFNVKKIIFCGRHIKSQVQQCISLGVDKKKFFFWGRKEIKLDRENFNLRSKDCLSLLNLITNHFQKQKIKYWLDLGSLLALVRKQDMAEVSDIELLVDFKDYKKMRSVLKKISNKQILLIDKNKYYSKLLDRSFTQNILIKKTKNNYEPAIIDFNLLVRKNNIYENLAKKKIIPLVKWNEIKMFKYKKLQIPVVKNYKKYLTFLYGKDWRNKKNFFSKIKDEVNFRSLL